MTIPKATMHEPQFTFPSVHNGGGTTSFNFAMSSTADMEGPGGSFECVQQTMGPGPRSSAAASLEVLGSIPYKVRVAANEDVYATTRHRMTIAEENHKNKCTREIKPNQTDIGRKVKLKQSRGAPLPPVRRDPPPLPPTSSSASSNSSRGVSSYDSSSKSSSSSAAAQHGGGNVVGSSNGNSGGLSNGLGSNHVSSSRPLVNKPSVPDIARRPMKERLIHYLALKPFKKVELYDRLTKESSVREKNGMTSILKQISFMKDNCYHLNRAMWSEVNEDWPFYTESERQMLKRRKPQNLTPPGSSDGGSSGSGQSPTSTHPGSPPSISSTKRPGYFDNQDGLPTKRQRISHYRKPSEQNYRSPAENNSQRRPMTDSRDASNMNPRSRESTNGYNNHSQHTNNNNHHNNNNNHNNNNSQHHPLSAINGITTTIPQHQQQQQQQQNDKRNYSDDCAGAGDETTTAAAAASSNRKRLCGGDSHSNNNNNGNRSGGGGNSISFGVNRERVSAPTPAPHFNHQQNSYQPPPPMIKPATSPPSNNANNNNNNNANNSRDPFSSGGGPGSIIRDYLDNNNYSGNNGRSNGAFSVPSSLSNGNSNNNRHSQQKLSPKVSSQESDRDNRSNNSNNNNSSSSSNGINGTSGGKYERVTSSSQQIRPIRVSPDSQSDRMVVAEQAVAAMQLQQQQQPPQQQQLQQQQELLKPPLSPIKNDNLDSTSSEFPDYLTEYTSIENNDQRRQYKADFNANYAEYKDLHNVVESVSRRFADLELRLKNEDSTSPRFLALKKQIFREYVENKKDPEQQRKKMRFQYLHEKLSHIKRLVLEYDQGRANDGKHLVSAFH